LKKLIMVKIRKRIYFSLAIIIIFFGTVLFLQKGQLFSFNNSVNLSETFYEPMDPPIIKDRVEIIKIHPGTTFGELMSEVGLRASLVSEIYNISLVEYDLARIGADREIKLSYCSETNILKSLYYQINSEDEFLIERDIIVLDNLEPEISDWQAKRQAIDYEVKIETKEAKIESSMYNAALNNNIDERAIISLANAFQWTLDFSMDSKKGDEFKFIYEARYLNDEYVRPGKILAAKYVNQGKEFRIYYFKESEDNKGYFNEQGESVQRMFLRAPLEYKYISSGFTTGQRYIQAFNISTGHRAIDYAAPTGTPIRAVGDGVVTYVGWKGSYGNFISIRHNGTYSTNYAHLSRFAVRTGQRVSQGDIIGYVGSTGLSTGPHLHYEMVKNGIKINPLTEVLPPGEAIKEENLTSFYEAILEWQKMLD
jgi:murein DD-endopeptidase MepM/ murein hydrolase activator NlpD